MSRTAGFIALVIVMGLLMWGGLGYVGQRENVRETAEPASGPASGTNTTGLPFVLPGGFSIARFADIPEARDLFMDPYGNFLVSTRRDGRVYALRDNNGDGDVRDPGEARVLLDGLNIPHGLAVRCAPQCELYVGETGQVSVYEYGQDMVPKNKRKILDLPFGRGHSTRSLLFLPDGKLLVSIGSSCNVCVEQDNRRAKILVADPDGNNMKVFASGLRNAVFMTFHPRTGEVWVTEMGRDHLSDDLPPEEIDIVREGRNYGWPYCYGERIHDGSFDPVGRQRGFCETTEPPHIGIQAHSAPLGLAFFPDDWPEEYRGDLLVAYHGSWNRSVPTGYKIVRFKLDDDGNVLGEEDFLSGFLRNDTALGRPVDILFSQNDIYISDDKSGAVYRMTLSR